MADLTDDLQRRLDEAEEIIRACRRLEAAMYNSDLERSWPTEAHDLLRSYETRHGVDLEPDSDVG